MCKALSTEIQRPARHTILDKHLQRSSGQNIRKKFQIVVLPQEIKFLQVTGESVIFPASSR